MKKRGHVWTQQERDAVSIRMKGNTISKGKTPSQYTRDLISKKLSGRKHSDIWNERIGIATRRRMEIPEERQAQGDRRRRKPWNSQSRQNMSKRVKGIPLSVEHRKNLSLATKGRPLTKEHRTNIIAGMAKSIGKQPKKNTKIEILVRNILLSWAISFEPQKHFRGIGIVDFFLPDFKIAIEADGIYWHGLPSAIEKDKRKDLALDQIGIRVLRLKEDIIKKDNAMCSQQIYETITRGII